MTSLDPIARLSLEHREIDRVLVAVSLVMLRTSAQGGMDRGFVAAVVDFIERFADGCHHEKEERVLFAELQAKPSKLAGPIACMSGQHEHCRELTGALKTWVHGNRAFRATHESDVRTILDRYVTVLWNHIATEDVVIFPAARSTLSPHAAARILAGYRDLSPESHEAFRAGADEVVALARSIVASSRSDAPVEAKTSLQSP